MSGLSGGELLGQSCWILHDPPCRTHCPSELAPEASLTTEDIVMSAKVKVLRSMKAQ